MKVQPQIVGRWTTNGFWEKLAQAKKAVRDAYRKVTGKNAVESANEEVAVISSNAELIPNVSLVYRKALKGYMSNVQGLARLQQQRFIRQGAWGRGMNSRFGRDFLWRRMRTGHLVGFATLFLVHEERLAEEAAFEKRMIEYEAVCVNIKNMFSSQKDKLESSKGDSELSTSISDYNLGECIAAGSNGAVYEAEAVVKAEGEHIMPSSNISQVDSAPARKRSPRKVAIKMIYNYDSSTASHVFKETKAEMITCGRGAFGSAVKNWQNGTRARMKLPSHPNIIKIKRAIFDRVPEHQEFVKMHPAALPQPRGFGRSVAMFFVMDRYDCTLRKYLEENKLSFTTRALLSLQLLNGVSHLEKNRVAHRDLKSNNILIESDKSGVPRLVIADFGCAYVAGNNEDLCFPYLSEEYDIRNGTPGIQPPEISNCVPGPDSILDYSKADAWAAGLLLCEIWGINRNLLDVSMMHENPDIAFIARLAKLLLEKDQKMRKTCSQVAPVLHLQLFGPHFHKGTKAGNVVKDWLLHASETFAYKSTEWGKDSVACDLFVNFLSALSPGDLRSSLSMWQILGKSL